MMLLDEYLKAFGRLKRGGTKYGPAPHKPVLLISLIELFDKGLIVSNSVYINADLVGTFKENWLLLVSTAHQADFTQPFFYLQNELAGRKPYWFLQPNPGCQINAHIKSVNTLEQVCDYGFFSEDLFLLLSDSFSRMQLKQVLLDAYFPTNKLDYNREKSTNRGYFHDQIIDVLNEPEAIYKRVVINTEEDVFVRNGIFKKFVPKIYHNRCSFTGMQINTTFNYNFIDACHIVPFSESHNDKIVNGIALCPNMHRAFDRGLLSIDADFRILVSRHIQENENHPYGLKQLEGREINLPAKENHYPDLSALAWHRGRVFKG
jgi:putative restriction endonuclease